jgi:hypothetical protein
VEGVALTTVGMILMIVGAIGFVVSLLYMFVWAHRGPYGGPPRGPYERPPPPYRSAPSGARTSDCEPRTATLIPEARAGHQL